MSPKAAHTTIDAIFDADNDKLLEMVLDNLLFAKMAAMRLNENMVETDSWYVFNTLTNAISTAQDIANMVE